MQIFILSEKFDFIFIKTKKRTFIFYIVDDERHKIKIFIKKKKTGRKLLNKGKHFISLN